MTERNGRNGSGTKISGIGNGLQQAAIIMAVGYYFAAQAGFLNPKPLPTEPTPSAVKELQKNRLTIDRIEKEVALLSTGHSPRNPDGVPIWHQHNRDTRLLVDALDRLNSSAAHATEEMYALRLALRSTSVGSVVRSTPVPAPVPEADPGVLVRFWRRLTGGET